MIVVADRQVDAKKLIKLSDDSLEESRVIRHLLNAICTPRKLHVGSSPRDRLRRRHPSRRPRQIIRLYRRSPHSRA